MNKPLTKKQQEKLDELKKDFDFEDMNKEELELMEAWARSKPVELEKVPLEDVSSVISIRFPYYLHEAAHLAAKDAGISLSTFVRQAVEEKLAMTDQAYDTLLAQVLARLVEDKRKPIGQKVLS